MIKPLILPYKGIMPRIHPSCFIAENAVIIGDVQIGPDSNIWYGCVLRGDVNNITIGTRTNIQDGTVIHVSSTSQGSYIGDDVTIGHMALIHACTIGDRVLVGMKACIMDDAQVADESMVAACALVPPRKSVPTRELWAGQPARLMRALTDDDIAHIMHSATHYVDLATAHKKY
ncbi:MAG: gamma carbonic anhydrase family protein [Pseudomonadota bacterium]